MKKIGVAKNILSITIPTLLALWVTLELIFRFVIPAEQHPRRYFDEAELLDRFDPVEKGGVYTIGKLAQQRGRWRINNYGWNSPIDYHERKSGRARVAIIGDSFIEALLVDTDESYPSLLRQYFKANYEVYSFGVSGAPLSQYLHMSRYVEKHFKPDIVIFNIVHNDFDESIYRYNRDDVSWLRLQLAGSHVKEIPPEPDYSYLQYNKHSIRNMVLRHSALLRYVYLNLQLKQSLNALLMEKREYRANVDVGNIEDRKNDILLATRYILNRIRLENKGKRLIIVMDAARENIYNGTEPIGGIAYLHSVMRTYCSEMGFEFVDLTGAMKKDYERKKIKFNSELDMHWNEYGHWFVYKQLAALL